jgi:outer membrane protein OmpA-like peptidoglycan-associated protein
MNQTTPFWLARTGMLLVLSALTACANVTDRVILLPQPDGSPSAVLVVAGQQTLLLDKPYATAEAKGGAIKATVLDAATVQKQYGAMLAQLPSAPRKFVVQFESNGNRLSEGADKVLDEMRAALASLPAAEVVVIGHTDRVGSVEANDKLSVVRAESVREILVAAGVNRSVISVAGRGEREPAVPTADEVAEARNRRVEIKIR